MRASDGNYKIKPAKNKDPLRKAKSEEGNALAEMDLRSVMRYLMPQGSGNHEVHRLMIGMRGKHALTSARVEDWHKHFAREFCKHV